MKKYISKLHYITQDLPNRSHVEQVRLACEAGANWIQYRCLTKNDGELISEIHALESICDDWGATLILTKHYHLLDQVDAQGVHMEDLNADFIAIRENIGEGKTLGGSATNPEELKRLQQSGVDYAGYGPFRHTETKLNNYPLLGFDGYKNLKNLYNIEIPVIAVGGVLVNDIEGLLQTDIYGIAASGAINLAENPAVTLKAFYNEIY